MAQPMMPVLSRAASAPNARKTDWEVVLAGEWKRIGVLEVQMLDAALAKGQTKVTKMLRGQQYEYDLEALTQTNLKTGKARQIRHLVGLSEEEACDFASASCKKFAQGPPHPVTLHVYHVGKTEGLFSVHTANGILNIMGTGAYHAAVQVYDLEWSFGAIDEGTGVFWCESKECPNHDYYQSLPLGDVKLTRGKVEEILNELKEEWQGEDYDLLKKNCCHFSKTFVERLGAPKPVPNWVMNLAGIGEKIQDLAIRGGQQRKGPGFDLRCNSYHFGDVTRGVFAVGLEKIEEMDMTSPSGAVSKMISTRGQSTSTCDSILALCGSVCSGICGGR